jgi:hypothetical protein
MVDDDFGTNKMPDWPHCDVAMNAPYCAVNSASLVRGSTFPVRLHAMLTEIEQTGLHSHIVAWHSHGRLFSVEDRESFIQKVLPWYVC